MITTPIQASPSVVAAQIDSELVLLDVVSGTYFGLDEVGTQVWESITSGLDSEELIARLSAEYDVTSERLREDIDALVSDLQSKGLIVASED